MIVALITLACTLAFGFAKPRIFDGIPVTSDSPLLKSYISIMVKIKGDPILRASGGATLISRL